jgi:hypothetical protein
MAATLRRCAVRHTDEGKRTTVSRRRIRVRAVVIGVAAASVCILAPLPIANADDPYLVGTWSGHRERIASTDGYRNGDATLVVTEQTGLTFKASLTRTNPGGDESDQLIGASTPDGTIITGSDAEGTYSFKLIDPVTLDYCYSMHGAGYRTTCGRLHRQV